MGSLTVVVCSVVSLIVFYLALKSPCEVGSGQLSMCCIIVLHLKKVT